MEGIYPIHAGFLCTPNYLIRQYLKLDLRTPFMMMMISPKHIKEIIQDDFNDFLNKDYYKRVDYGPFREITHDKYPELTWNHRDVTEKGHYDRLVSDVENVKAIFEKAKVVNFIVHINDSYTSYCQYVNSRYLIEYKRSFNQIVKNMYADLGNSLKELVGVMNDKYPKVKTNICLYTRNRNVGMKYHDPENNIYYIHTAYPMNLWEILDEKERDRMVDEIGKSYENFVETYCK